MNPLSRIPGSAPVSDRAVIGLVQATIDLILAPDLEELLSAQQNWDEVHANQSLHLVFVMPWLVLWLK